MITRALRRLLAGSIVPTSLSPTAAASASAGTAESVTAGETHTHTDSLDVCLLSYRSDPYSGGQGVYVKHLSRALADRGHSVDVISGRPYPDLASDVTLVELPSENIIDEEDRLGAFDWGYLREPTKLFEWASVLTGGFPEPYTFGRRVVKHFTDHDLDYDVVHDNQSLCYGLLDLADMGVPTVATVHHPITVDRDLALQHAESRTERLLVRRWYRFLKMQQAVARELPRVIAVSEATKRRTADDFRVAPDAMRVVHNGIDTDRFAPRDDVGGGPPDDASDNPRIVTTVSADTPLKGARYLLAAFARVRSRTAETNDSGPELAVVGEFDEDGATERLAAGLGIEDAITTHSEISDAKLVDLYASATLAVVPSLYEGFGFPAGEAMACGVPVVATRGGALPEVVGNAGVLVPPGDAAALADAVTELLADAEERTQLGERGRRRMCAEFDWDETARETVDEYRRAIAHADG